MKILQLNLLAVGPFTDVSLDLSGGQHGLHVVLGRNEAGKSSALRALRSFLYGFPGQTSDNFIHENMRLKVGATLRHSDGAQVTLVRRKGNQNTLLDCDGKPVDDTILGRFLGSVDQELFKTFFGIGHESLREGGEQILHGGGRIGESLFAAGAGGLRLRKLKDQIEERADALYKPKARNAKIPTAIAKFRDEMDTVKKLSLPVQDWSRHDEELSKAKKEVAEVQREIDRLSTRRNRLERLSKAIPLVARRRAAIEAIAVLGDVPALGDDFPERRRTAFRALQGAEESGTALAAEISRLEKEIAQLQIPDDLLQQAQSIELLNGQLRSYQQARQEAPALRIRRDEARTDAQRILRDVRPEAPIEQVESLRLGTARREQLQLLSRESEALKQSLKSARKSLADLEEEKRQTEIELADLPAARDAKALQVAITNVQKQGDLEKLLADESAALKVLTRRAESGIAKLGLWSGSIASVEMLAVPSSESIEQARGRQEKIDSDRDKAAAEIRRLEAELGDVDHKLEVLRAGGEIPTEAELRHAREHREQGWSLIHQLLVEGNAPDTDVANYTAGVPLVDAFEKSVVDADAVADRLRAESDRVAQQATLALNRKPLEDKLQRERQRVTDASAELTKMLADWKSLWATIGIEPLSPKEMASWTTRQRELAQTATSLVEKTAQLAERNRQITLHRQTMIAALREIAEPIAEDAILGALLAQAEKVVERVGGDAIERSKKQATIKNLDGKIARARDGLAAAEREHAAWHARWEVAVALLGVPAAADPAVALAIVKQIDELFLKIDSIQKIEGDIAARQTHIDAFEKQAAELVARLAADAQSTASDQAVIALYVRLKKARVDDARRKEMAVQLQQARQNLEKARRNSQTVREAQAALLRTAGCDATEDLPAVETQYLAMKQSLADRSQAEDQLQLLSNGESLDELVQEVMSLNADALPSQLLQLHIQMESLSVRRAELDEKIVQERVNLSQWDGNARASEAAERAQELLADLRSDAENYARLNLAAAVLRRGIDRYRQRKQGPLLGRASGLFADLTLGSFTGLRADYDDKDQPILLGMRESGSVVNVSNMSDGTRDQLYLALRLATLEDFLSRGEPIPFVVDDILVNFDNARSQATLKILADLSTKTQVILFTHHAHIATMAGEIGEMVFQTALDNPPHT